MFSPLSKVTMSSTLIDLINVLQDQFYGFVNKLIDIKNEGNTFTLIIICGILLLLTLQFMRWVWRYLFDTQPIEDLLHFKAAPAGFSYIYHIHVYM